MYVMSHVSYNELIHMQQCMSHVSYKYVIIIRDMTHEAHTYAAKAMYVIRRDSHKVGSKSCMQAAAIPAYLMSVSSDVP